MITHIVAFRLLAPTAEERHAHVVLIQKGLEELVEQIDGLDSLTVREDLGDDSTHWHCVLISTHPTVQALADYQAHPAHRAAAAAIGVFVEARAIVDFA